MSDDLIRRSDAIKEINAQYASNNITHEVGLDMSRAIENISAVEPNLLIAPETIERGNEVFIGDDIVVVHQEDYTEMKCKAMMWEEYGEEPKHGEWIYHRAPDDWIMSLYSCSECDHIEEGKPNFCPNCGARMFAKDINVPNKEGADDER